jgi:spermidine synthase
MAVVTPGQPSLRRLVFAAVFVVSAAGLIFEITLTRLFSLFFQYHFTFLAVSLAVFGLSLGAASAHFVRPQPGRAGALLGSLLAGLSLALAGATVFIAWLPSAEGIFPRAIVALIPFFLTGLFSALAFEQFASQSGRLYAADLIGAAVGVVAVLALLTVWSAFSMTLFLAALVGGLALVFALAGAAGDNRQRALAFLSFGLGLALLVVNLATGAVDFHPATLTGAPRDKTMIAILQDPTQGGRIDYTAWSPFSRVDVVETNDPSSRYVFTDGGAGSYMLADATATPAMTQAVEYLPFLSGETGQTLVVGAGGGKDVVLALNAGAQAVTAVEVNPAVISATRRFASYNGNILDLPQVETVEGDARSFVERTDERYDLIYLNLVYTQAVEPASQTLVENYIFTQEAFAAFYDRLAPGGRLAIVSHNALEASRAAITALQMMEARGIPPIRALDNLWLWMMPASDATVRTSVMILSKDALPESTILTLNREAASRGMQPLYAPGSYETLFEPLRQGGSMASYVVAGGDYNLRPTTDDSPYFFNLDYGLPPAIRSALVTASFVALVLLGVGLFAPTHARQGTGLRRWLLVLYALLIGAGFMLVEVPLIQRFQLLLGQPILSLAAVLATLLLAGGLGSLWSQRWPTPALPRRVAFAALAVVIIALAYAFFLPALTRSLLSASFAVRLLATMGFTALLGLPMGIPFPSLLRLAGLADRERVPLLWAVNGAFSVLGSTLTVVIAMNWGFSGALLIGAALYLGLAALLLVAARVGAPAAVPAP